MTSLRLQDFGTPSDGQASDQPPQPSPDYLAGFEDGCRKTQEQMAAETHRLRATLVARLEDLAFTHAEARRQVLAALQPSLLQLSRSVVPQLVQEGFSAWLREALEDAFDRASGGPLILHLAPDQIGSVADTLGQAGPPSIDLRADPGLTRDQARITAGESEELIDLPALIATLQDALAALITEERSVSHG